MNSENENENDDKNNTSTKMPTQLDFTEENAKFEPQTNELAQQELKFIRQNNVGKSNNLI